MQKSIILTDKSSLKEFCKELNLDYDYSKILIRVNNQKADYYNYIDKRFHELDLEIAMKYIERD